MLRVHIVQVCYNLSDPGMEDLLYEAESVRRFVGLRLTGPLPDESTILHFRFRHLLERHNLGQGLFTEVKEYLAEQGVWLKEGTIVDATIIQAPSSTKNRSGQRDPSPPIAPQRGNSGMGGCQAFGVQKREENLGSALAWQVTLRPGRRRKLEPDSPEARVERTKASVRAIVDHPFLESKGSVWLRQ